MQSICLLGASGSVGESTLKVLRKFPQHFRLHSLSVHSNEQKAKQIIEEFHPEYLIVTGIESTTSNLGKTYKNTKILYGYEALTDIVTHLDVDIVVTAIVGAIGIYPTIAAIESNKKIAIANKETLVTFGPILKKLLKKSESILVPVDSEHNALFQLLEKVDKRTLRALTLTASGGTFRDTPVEKLPYVTVEETLKHPTWKMGPKITVDSAGLINKCLEVFEAHFLFDVSYESIEVVIHPESIVHGAIELIDGSQFLYASHPDMIFPVAHSLFYPNPVPELLIEKKPHQIQSLQFRPVDHSKYPALKLAYEVGKKGGTGPALFNAANEIAAGLFLNHQIPFTKIPEIIDNVLQKIPIEHPENLEGFLKADSLARKLAENTKD